MMYTDMIEVTEQEVQDLNELFAEYEAMMALEIAEENLSQYLDDLCDYYTNMGWVDPA